MEELDNFKLPKDGDFDMHVAKFNAAFAKMVRIRSEINKDEEKCVHFIKSLYKTFLGPFLEGQVRLTSPPTFAELVTLIRRIQAIRLECRSLSRQRRNTARARLLTMQSTVASSEYRATDLYLVYDPHTGTTSSPGTTAFKKIASSHRRCSQTASIPINTSPSLSAVPTGSKHSPATSQHSRGCNRTKEELGYLTDNPVGRDCILSTVPMFR